MEQIIVSALCIVFGLIAFYAVARIEVVRQSYRRYIEHCRAEQKKRELRNRAGLYDRVF